MSSEALTRLVNNLKNKAARLPENVSETIKEVLRHIEQGKVVVYKPASITADLHRPQMVSFEHFWCPRCGAVYEWSNVVSRAVGSEFPCHSCGYHLQQAYVGAPIEVGFRQPLLANRFPSPTVSQDYLILPTSSMTGIYCARHGRLKGLKAVNPLRPLYSLRFTCPANDTSCKSYDGKGFCAEGGKVFFPKQGGIERSIGQPSEGLTKPFSEVTFEEVEEEKDLTDEVANLLESQVFSRAGIGRFRVHVITLFYLVGHSYAARWKRMPVLITDEGGRLWAAGRSMTTMGLILRLRSDAVSRTVESLRSLLPVDEYVTAHSISHAAVKALARLTGLSFKEFGEAVYVGGGEPEVLIYDDSPGGIGGVRTVVDALPDFTNYLRDSAGPCPRACRLACRACLYIENCGSLNFLLSWMAADHFLRGA